MYLRSRDLILRWFRVPVEPHAPAGNPASLRVFRAGKSYFNLRLLGWALAQGAALAGIIFWTTVFIQLEGVIRERREGRTPVPAVPAATAAPTPTEAAAKTSGAPASASVPGSAPAGVAVAAPTLVEELKSVVDPQPSPSARGKGRPPKNNRVRLGTWTEFKEFFILVGLRLPLWCFPLLWALKLTGIFIYIVQVPLTYAVRRLDYEMRWYIVTDRSLRIRTGVWQVQEQTMSFANLQQVVVTQGPVQGFLGLSDVRVQSAGGGGGGGSGHQQGQRDSLHTAVFHSVENAAEIRDLILERLRLFRATGLGDPDEGSQAEIRGAGVDGSAQGIAPNALISNSDAVAAAKELLAEARELRKVVGGGLRD